MKKMSQVALGAWAWDNDGTFGGQLTAQQLRLVRRREECRHRFDQCGVVLYLDAENWLKGSIEYENERFQHLGSVVTNHG